jgi:hypothetical protein
MEHGSFRVVEQSRLEGAVVYVEADRQLRITRIARPCWRTTSDTRAPAMTRAGA